MADFSDDIRSFIQGGIDPVTFEEISEHHPGRPHRQRRMVARLASVVVLVAVAVPVILAVSSARSTTSHDGHGQARRRVIAALDATIASGSFNISFSQQPLTAPTSTTTTTTNSCAVAEQQPQTIVGGIESKPVRTKSKDGRSVPATPLETSTGSSQVLCAVNPGTSDGLSISGQGTIDTNPFAMVVNTEVPGFGQITLRDDGTNVWELGGGNYGLSPGAADDGPGSSLPGFAGLVEGTLGSRQGALDMMVLANPTGYLELDENAITTADPLGPGTVDGVPVTVYQVTLDPAQEATVTGTNTDESTAIQAALALLKEQGYTGTTVKISIDAAGYIRQTVSTANFADGASQTGETTFSDFGCAGTVLMPGQQGATSPPPGCVSPDSTTTTTVAPDTSPPTIPTTTPVTTPSTAPTTIPPATPLVTTPPRSTTTTTTTTTTSSPTTSTAPTS
jgi:hypothetical protein